MVALTWKDITFNYFGNFLSVNSKSNTFILYFRKKLLTSVRSARIFLRKRWLVYLAETRQAHLRNPGNQLLEFVQIFYFDSFFGCSYQTAVKLVAFLVSQEAQHSTVQYGSRNGPFRSNTFIIHLSYNIWKYF